MKIAIAGSGAMGSRFGFMLHQAGNDVRLIDKWEEHIQKIREEGLKVDFNGEHHVVDIPIFLPREVEETVDVVFVFTKAMFLDEMLNDIQPILDENTKVVCLLNGVGHEQVLEKYVPLKNILIGVTIWTAGLRGPGEIVLQGNGTTEIQNFIPGKANEQVAREIVQIIDEAGLNGIYSMNVKFSIWRKACVNGVMNAICALLDANLKEVFSTKEAPSITKGIVSEFVAVAQKQGVELNFDDTVHYIIKSANEIGHHYPSMHQDLMQNNRLTEIDYINGAVARLSKHYGLDASMNQLITDLIHVKESILKIK